MLRRCARATRETWDHRVAPDWSWRRYSVSWAQPTHICMGVVFAACRRSFVPFVGVRIAERLGSLSIRRNCGSGKPPMLRQRISNSARSDWFTGRTLAPPEADRDDRRFHVHAGGMPQWQVLSTRAHSDETTHVAPPSQRARLTEASGATPSALKRPAVGRYDELTREGRRQYDCHDREDRRRDARTTTHHVQTVKSASCSRFPHLAWGARRAR